ncbi:Pth4 protein [Martiniozyma asiatica (nom. inval.)]|nr:Pth4 protein [Martiniozyma asiatica]
MIRKYMINQRNFSKLSNSLSVAQLKPDSSLLKYFQVSYARSSGAGGQHVNTTSSKAVLRLDSSNFYSARSKWIPAELFDNILKNSSDSTAPQHKKFPYFTPSGDVLIASSETRYRDKNLEDCLKKFCDAVNTCGIAKEEIDDETKKRWDKLEKRDNKKRLDDKKRHGEKKMKRKVKMDW